MLYDRKVLYGISAGTLMLLLLALVIPYSSSRVVASVLLLPALIFTCVFIKRRTILSLERKQISWLVGICGILYVLLIYLTGLEFGFGNRSAFGFKFNVLVSYCLPISTIIVTTEIIRRVVLAQKSRFANVLCYLSCVCAELLISYNVHSITSFNRFMDAVAVALLPAFTSNLVYVYISLRYGALPNIVYRLITVMYYYLIPVYPLLPDSLHAIFKLLAPLLVLGFISALYEKRKRYALKKSRSKWGYAITAVVLAFMISVVMLISCQFRYGALVIATESMTGELNKGDAAIFEQYDDQTITVGQVIVFDKNNSNVVHRVARIERVNGVNRYYTKGDANDDLDAGYILESNIIGIVEAKVPVVGYPSIWLRKIVEKGVG